MFLSICNVVFFSPNISLFLLSKNTIESLNYFLSYNLLFYLLYFFKKEKKITYLHFYRHFSPQTMSSISLASKTILCLVFFSNYENSLILVLKLFVVLNSCPNSSDDYSLWIMEK